MQLTGGGNHGANEEGKGGDSNVLAKGVHNFVFRNGLMKVLRMVSD